VPTLADSMQQLKLPGNYEAGPGIVGVGAFSSTDFVVVRGRLRRAYAIYLFHQGINALFHLAIFGGRTRINGWSSLGVPLLSLLTVLLLSAISWRLLEKPLIRHAHSTYQYAK